MCSVVRMVENLTGSILALAYKSSEQRVFVRFRVCEVGGKEGVWDGGFGCIVSVTVGRHSGSHIVRKYKRAWFPIQ